MTPATSARYRAMRAYQRARLGRARLLGRANRWSGVRILGYHRVAETRESLSVPPARFRTQLETVLASGAQPVTLSAALDLIAAGETGGQHVAVTFDDGYLDNLEQGEPILAELGFAATVFLPTAVIDGEAEFFWYRDPPPALTWEDARGALRRGVVDFASHTRTHRWLPELGDDDARSEIEGSKEELEQRLGVTITTLCYPGGLYGAREERFVAEAGYRAGVTTEPGVNSGGERSLKRTLVYGEDDDDTFAAKLAGLLDGTPLLRRIGYRRLGGFARRSGV